MRSATPRFSATLAGLALAIICTTPALADDSEVFTSTTYVNSKGVRPNILFIVDTSGSMNAAEPNYRFHEDLRRSVPQGCRLLEALERCQRGAAGLPDQPRLAVRGCCRQPLRGLGFLAERLGSLCHGPHPAVEPRQGRQHERQLAEPRQQPAEPEDRVPGR